MPWCKKKPIAVQFYDLKETDVDMNGNALTDGKTKDGKYYIKTLESNRHIVDPEIDYVMIGIKGERYAIKKEIFKKTYEIVLHVSECGVYTNPDKKCDCVK